MVKKSVIKIIEKYLHALQDSGLPISQVFLFGSQATGKAQPDSDIDLLLVSPLFDEDRLTRAVDLWKIAFTVDSRIEPIPVGEKAFQTDNITPIYEIVRQEGIRII